MTRKLVVIALTGALSWCGLAGAPESGDLERFRQQYERLSRDYDPITLTSSERLHGWMSGDGILAFLLMYEATGQERHLHEFIRHADRLLKLRDAERGLQDHRGESLPAWRSEDTYLSAQCILRNGRGEPTLSFLTPMIYRWSERLSEGGPGRHLLRVEHVDRTRFSLVLTVNAGAPQQKIYSWENLTMDRNAPDGEGGDYAPRRFEVDETLGWRRQFNLFDLEAPGTPEERMPAEGEFLLTEGRYTRITNTGTMSFPLAYFARMVLESNTLRESPQFRESAERYVEAARLAVAVHDDEWRENERGEGWYIARQSAPQWSAGVDLPINQSNVLGLTMIELARATRDPRYRDRATKLARAFKNDMEHVEDDDAYLWSYWLKKGQVGSRLTQKSEDLGHAGPNVLFAYWCYENDIIFSRRDLQRIANSMLKYVFRSDGTIAGHIGGEETGIQDELWRFLPLGLVDPAIYQQARDWALSDGIDWLDRNVEGPAPVDPVARQKNRHHRLRLTWAALAWISSQLD